MAASLERAMLNVFSTLDDGQLRCLAALPTRREPRPPRMGMRRNGKVSVRREQPAEAVVTRHEVLKAAAENEQNWAWGQEEAIGRYRQHN